MTSDKKLEQEVQPLSWGSKDSAERIRTDSEIVEERISFPRLQQSEEPGQLLGKNDEESGLRKDESDASHAGNAILIGQSTPPPLSVHPSLSLQRAKRR